MTIRVYLDANGQGQGSAYFDDGDYVCKCWHKLNYLTLSDHLVLPHLTFLDSIDEGKYSLINFAVKDKTLVGNVAKSGFGEVPTLETVLIYGECGSVTKLEVNGKQWSNFAQNKTSCVSLFKAISIPSLKMERVVINISF